MMIEGETALVAGKVLEDTVSRRNVQAKVCLVGPQGVGKTSIAARIDGIAISSQSTIPGTKFASCNVIIGEKTAQLLILDIPGEERLKCLAPIYSKNARVALCVFDLTSEKTLLELPSWIHGVRNVAADECLLIILGNKLEMKHLQGTGHRARRYAESIGAKYFEVSAVTGQGLMPVIIYIAKKLLRWNNCYFTYAAKRAVALNFIEHNVPSEKRMTRRWSFPFRRLSLKNVVT